jgi:branched-chain amino acid transport system ATP-binding protein
MLLEVVDLNVAYGDAPALWDVSLNLEEGEIVSIVGPNGAGKTTLVNAIVGLVSVRSGSIRISGWDGSGVPAHEVSRHGVAIVPEDRRIFPDMSVEDNLDIGAFRRPLRAGAEERREWVYSLFPILKERQAQVASNLSGGEQQQLAIGRALMSDPQLLLLDEPSLGLAPVLVDEVFGVIENINASGVSVLLVEQEITRALGVANRGYLLAEGRIALEGEPRKLLDDPEVRQACLGI